MKATMNGPKEGQSMGWQYYFRDKVKGRESELSLFTKLVIKARASEETRAKLSLITTNADAYAASVSLTKEWQEIPVSLNQLDQGAFLLLPRPYPGFQPLFFKAEGNRPFSLADAERLEVSFGQGAGIKTSPFHIEVESVWLIK